MKRNKLLAMLLLALMVIGSLGIAGAEEAPPTVTILLSGDNTPSASNIVLDKLGEATNTTIDMIYVPSADKETKLSTMAAGGTLPDIFLTDINTAQEFKEAGWLADLTDYLDSAPNLMADCGDILEDCAVNSDGTYMIISGRTGYADQLNLRTDWLENLGLDMPTDLDSLYDVFHAFTYDDPDGDGEQNTFGLAANTSNDMRAFATIFGAFGIPRNSTIILEDNTLTTWVKHPNFLSAVDYIRTLIADGLVEPDWVTIPQMDMFGKLWNGVAGSLEWECVGPTNNWMPARYTEDPVPTFDFPIIAGPDGISGVPMKFPDVNSGYVISASADIEACMRIADFCKSPDGSDLLYLGVEGVMFEWLDKDIGSYQYLGEYTDSATHRAAGGFCYWGLFVPQNNAELRTLNQQTQEGVALAWSNGLENTANVRAVLQTRIDYGADLDQIIREMYAELLSATGDVEALYADYIEQWENAGGLEWEAEVNEAWIAQGSQN